MRFDQKTYMKTYRAKNKERLAAQKKAYNEANKDKISAYHKAYRGKYKEKIKAYNKIYGNAYRQTKRGKEVVARGGAKYYQTDKGKAQAAKKTALYKKRHPEKVRAHADAYNARERGDLIRLPCEVCGTTKDINAHHDDYEKPLEVRWLCRTHHLEHHSRIRNSN